MTVDIIAAPVVNSAAASSEASVIIAISLAVFLLRPVDGLMIDLVKIMMRLALIGAVLNLIPPLQFVSQQSAHFITWLGVPAGVAPGLSTVAIFALSTLNIPFVPARVEQGIRVGLYIVGGAATVGAPAWTAFGQAIGSVVSGFLGLLTSALGIFTGWLPKS